MKKLLIILFISLFFLIGGCGTGDKKETVKPEYPYEIISKKVDMSSYEGVSSTEHNFRIINCSELFNTIDEKSSGIFFLGHSSCGCCQDVCRYIDETAREMGVTVYYINVDNKEDPIGKEEMIDRLYEYLEPILGYADGKKSLLTPQVFSVINGEFGGSQICMDGYDIGPDSSAARIEKFKDAYRAIFRPFVQ